MGSSRNTPGENSNGQIPSKPGEGESGEFEDAAVTTRKRRWMFRLFSVIAIPLLIIVLAEVGLRLGSFGYSTSFFHRQSIDQQGYWIDNPQYGYWFFPPAMARTPNPFAFPVIKPPQTSRIFVLGESAALGDPVPKFGMGRMLQRLLQARYTNQQFEVVNVAMTAINSHAIRHIAQDCSKRQGDFWIVYMGNNEVVGPFGPGTGFGSDSLSLKTIRAALWLKQWRVGQGLDWIVQKIRGFGGAPQYWTGMELMSERRIHHTDPALKTTYNSFKNNLEEIISAGVNSGAHVLLCTVAVNLRDCPPFASLHKAGLLSNDQTNWHELYIQGNTAYAAGKMPDAATFYEKAVKIDDSYAELSYRWAQCLVSLGRTNEAQKLFAKALDQDALRFRCDSEINRIIRDVGNGSKGVTLVDAATVFANSSPHRMPGNELFYEHVHLTPTGNYLLARTLAEEIAGKMPDTNTVKTAWLSQDDCLFRLGYAEWNESQALRMMLDRMKQPPFPGTLDYSNRLVSAQNLVTVYLNRQSPLNYQKQASQAAKAVASYPNDWELRENCGLLFGLGQEWASAIEHLQAAIQLMPHAPGPHFSLGGILSFRGRTDEAIEQYLICLKINPGSFETLMRLGLVEINRQQFKEAIPYLEAAVKAKPDSSTARLNLAGSYHRVRRNKEARQQLQEVLRMEPNNAEATKLLNLVNSM